ncbi:protein Dok-7-like isoform X3 [Cyprinus carpio]|uniref:Protein Dok-7-like isoform X3 n=1 Tax=Cyprinus carpio TaxID=7962 RepID=A0A9Q9YBH4_CYPCA|nr:protein Dok-7-like isoform X3 [Cyprinus carpio]
MMSDNVIAEGAVKIRDGKKWRSRWLRARKPSPVADCLVLYMYKERGVKERSVTLEHICGLEACVGGDGVPFILSILCLSQTTVLGFDSREVLQSWDLRLRYCLGEVHSFSVSVLPGTKLESGPATLHLCNNVLVIAKDLPAVIIGHWNLLDLRRYGPVSNGFVFEGGTRCGYWAGVFFLSCAEAEQISFLFDCIVRGISPSRGPFGLKPLLPEPSISAASAQDRLKHEAEELERRLSLLSHSTASSSRFSSSLAGDDRSISGSSDTSDTSQSDCSISGRPAPWNDPILPGSAETSHPQIPRMGSQVEEKLQVQTDPIRSRKLKESGRQNSSDSGIATGSHSSCTGSFSSYSRSLDAAGPGEEYRELFNLPEKHLCTCSTCPVHEYQVPSSLRFLYDSPRSLLEVSRHSSSPQDETGLIEPCSESSSQSDSELHKGEESQMRECQGFSCSKSCCDWTICSVPPAGMKSLFTTCPVCGGLKGTFPPHPGGTSLPAVPDNRERICAEKGRMDPAYEIMDSRSSDRSPEEERSRYELMKISPHLTEGDLRSECFCDFSVPFDVCVCVCVCMCDVCVFSLTGSVLTDRLRGDTVTYVNIPTSPTSKKQLHYMELELQESSAAVRGKSSSKYAQIDITATEAAHRAGSQHALGREEGLQRLEQQRRRRGLPHTEDRLFS